MAIRRTAIAFAFILICFSTSSVRAEGNINWKTANGPAGGLINTLAQTQNVPGVIYAGTNGGVYLTRDSGAHWQLVSKGLPDDPTITALAVTRNPNIVFAGTHIGLYRTRDTGATWTLADQRFPDQHILCILIDPQNPTTIYAGTTTTVLRSDDEGETWTNVGTELRSARVRSLALTPDSSALYAATETGISVSRDRGTHWQASSDGLAENTRPQSIVITSRGFIAGSAQGLYRSRDGKNWTAIGGQLANALPYPVVNDVRQPDRVYAVTPQGIYRSTDGGAAWTALVSPLNNVPILSLMPGEKNILFAGTARGIWQTTEEGTSWSELNAGLVSTTVHQLLFTADGSNTLFAATPFGLHYSRDRGISWNEARGLTDPYILSLASNPANPKEIYAGAWGGALFVSKDGGISFTRLTENLASKSPIGSLVVQHLTADSDVIYAGTFGGGLFKSIDAGIKWTLQTNGLVGVRLVTALTLVPPATLYAGTDRGVFRLDGSNAAAVWENISTGLPNDEVRAIIYDPQKSQTLFVGFASNGIFRSDNGGGQWNQVGSATFPTRVRLQTLALNPAAPNIIYAGTQRGAYRSSDNGTTWTTANDGLPPNAKVLSIVLDPQTPENLLAGTDGNGVVQGSDPFRIMPSNTLLIGIATAMGLALFGLVIGLFGWRTRFSPAAREKTWSREWVQWDTAIKATLSAAGEANEHNLSKLPRRHLSRALQLYQQEHLSDALFLQASPVALKQENFVMIQRFLSHWKAAWEITDSEEAFKSVTSQMVDQLCEMLGFTRIEERSYKGLIGYVVKAPSLRLKIPPRFPIIFMPRHQVEENDLQILRDLMGILNMVSYFALIVDLRDTPAPDPRKRLKYLVREAIHDFIVLDGNDIRYLLTARDHSHRLIEIILGQVDLTVISPYVTSGPVPANMFFGREYELKTIVRTTRDTNYAIVGGRKIGKTSVLARVHQLLQDAPEYHPFYLDCQAVQSHEDFFNALDTMWKLDSPPKTPEGFRRMATDLIKQDPTHTTVMLFDEIDGLLKYDIEHGELLFRIMRALTQEGPLRFIFCGEKILNAALHNPKLVFFNFCNLMPLTYLTPEEARRVVIDPMQGMGITLQNEGIADAIAELAAGHPNIVQYVCQKLIERINERREREIRYNDVEAIAQSAQFAEYFAEVSWGNANPLERLITLLMLEHPQTTMGEMAETLRLRDLKIPPDQLEAAFNDLTLHSILRRDGPKYTFAAKTFPVVLRRSQDVYGLVLSFTQEIQEGNGASA